MENEQPQYNIYELADKWVNGTITPEEKAYYEKWYQLFDDSETQFKKETAESGLELSEKIYDQLDSRIRQDEKRNSQRILPMRWFAIAASALLFLSAGGYFLFRGKPAQLSFRNLTADIQPGSNKAILHLAGGRKIYLADAANGKLSEKNGNSIVKTAGGSVVYKESAEAEGAMVYDTLVIPRGGSYRLTLPDGSKVWLNAATAIRYPEGFRGKERLVNLLYGEAYFEVVHNAGQPFGVSSPNQLVEDIGTHFNINAYPDESSVRTTLLEGAVKISAGSGSRLLNPGQQSLVDLAIHTIVTRSVDAEEDVAWKNGYFRFSNERIESIMRKLSRWYDIDVRYSGAVTDEVFYGKVSRFKNISTVLKMLEDSKGVHFKVEGRRITVIR